MVHQTARAQNKAIKLAFRVQPLDSVKQTADNIMSAGSLSAGKDDAHIEGSISFPLTRDKLNQRHPVSVGKQLFDFLLVGHRLSGCAFLYRNITLQTFG